MSEIRVSLLGQPEVLAAARARMASQHDNLCGAFWGRLALEAFCGLAFEDEEDVASAAGTVVVVDDPEPEASLPWRGQGVVTSSGPYRVELATAAAAAEAGTSPAGVAHSVEALSNGALVAVPITAPKWSADLLTDVLSSLAALPPGPLLAVANIGTRYLDGSQREFGEILDVLLGGQPLASSAPDWDVGHFCVLAGLLHGPTGTLVLVCDTYEAFGAHGWSVQRPEAVAAALHRDGAGTGGILIVVPAADAPEVRVALASSDVELEMWSNGSPEPPRG